MKKFQNKGFSALVILCLLSLYGQQAFAFSSGHFIQKDSGDRLFTQTYQNTEGLLFQQISFGHLSEYSENSSEYFFGTGSLGLIGNLHFRKIHIVKNSPYYLQDRRNGLKQIIFPFHFFW